MSTKTNAVELVRVQARYASNDPTYISYASGTYDANMKSVMEAAGFPAIVNIGSIYGINDDSLTVIPGKMAESNNDYAQGLYFDVATEAAMLALSTARVGARCARTDVDKVFVLSALPASTLGNWSEE